jgi:hypothetical protein
MTRRIRILSILALGLIWNSYTAAQQPRPHVVYVDVDFAQAKEFESIPTDDMKTTALKELREGLASSFRHIPRLNCWNLQAIPPDPQERASRSNVIKVEFITSSRPIRDTTELSVSVYLAVGNQDQIPLHDAPKLPLLAVGEVQRLIEGGDWRAANGAVILKFDTLIRSYGTKASDIFLERNLPIAHGLEESTPVGALLPINHSQFHTHPHARFMIDFYEAMGNEPKARMISQGTKDYRSLHLRVKHQSLDNRNYEPLIDFKRLQLLTRVSIRVMEFGQYEDPAEFDQ